MSEHRIRYIIGAGASALAIPTVQGFIMLFSKWEKNLTGKFGSNNLERVVLDRVHREMIKLSSKVNSTFSIDTYARMLWIRGDFKGLNALKTTITLLLTLEQLNRPSDKRYDVFLGSLLQRENDQLIFPRNIQIISWNYDFQIELSLAKILGVNPDKIDVSEVFEPHQFVRVNGAVLCPESFKKSNKEPKYVNGIDVYKCWPLIKKAGTSLYRNRDSIGAIKFAWEEERNFSEINSFKPNVTVIVGYSFPTFNREVDLNLFETYYSDQSDPVYIQCNSPDSVLGNQEVRSKLLGMGVQKHRIKDVLSSSEFLVPYEFNVPKKDPWAGVSISVIQ